MKKPDKVLVVINGGLVNEVFTSRKGIEVHIVDEDQAEVGETSYLGEQSSTVSLKKLEKKIEEAEQVDKKLEKELEGEEVP